MTEIYSNVVSADYGTVRLTKRQPRACHAALAAALLVSSFA
ncbi:MAG: hypothetical protein ACLSA6_18210 [Holdemania massiliensis]